jgi:carboxymethylenebutenolidase
MHQPVTTQWLDIAPGFAGFLALPPGASGTGPGLVLWQEIFGVNAHIQAVARQYALAGFVVLAPDAFWRQAPRVELGYTGDDRERALSLMQGYGSAEALADAAAAVALLRARPEVAAAGGRVGTIGYCMGGRLAWLTAATTPVQAAVSYYGGGIHGMLDRAANVGCPVQFHYAEHDDHIPPSAVEKVKDAHAAAGKTAEVHVYPGTMHGFNCWARASYQAAAATLAHGRSLVFLGQALHPVHPLRAA